MTRTISLVPFVCGAGASTAGAEQGALYCQEHGLEDSLRARGISARWAVSPQDHWAAPQGQSAHMPLPPLGDPRRLETVLWHLDQMADHVEQAVRGGDLPVTIGGDHSMAAGSLAGLRRAIGPDLAIGVVWVDAHADLHSYQSSSSKALHGMPMGTLLGVDDTLRVAGITGAILEPQNVLYAGLRDVESAEHENAARLGMVLPDMDSLRRDGVEKSLGMAVSALAGRCDVLALSIDLDGFSSTLAPATGTPVDGGFLFDEILPVLARITRDYDVRLIDLVEFNPTLDGPEKTYNFMLDILSEILPAGG